MEKIRENWNIGGAFISPKYILALKEFLNQMEMNDVKLTIFDSHHSLLWNGGNPQAVNFRNKELFLKMVEKYNSENINFNLVFTNLFIEEKHLSDARCNYILEKCYRKGNGIIVASHTLARYIKEKFPDYKLIHSLTHMNLDVEYYTELKDLYDIFVLPPDMNYEKNKLERLLKEFGGERIEVLVNETCYRGCPYQREHYNVSSKAVIENNADLVEQLHDSFCSRLHQKQILKTGGSKELLNIKSYELNCNEVNELISMGFCNFKLSTRDMKPAGFIGEIEKYILERYNIKKSFSAFKKYFYDNNNVINS